MKQWKNPNQYFLVIYENENSCATCTKLSPRQKSADISATNTQMIPSDITNIPLAISQKKIKKNFSLSNEKIAKCDISQGQRRAKAEKTSPTIRKCIQLDV